ncbi:hypothetical protein [Streptomyces pharetrae]
MLSIHSSAHSTKAWTQDGCSTRNEVLLRDEALAPEQGEGCRLS